MHKDGYMSSIDDLYNLKRCMSINDSYHKGMFAREMLCLWDVRSDISLHVCLTKLEQQLFHLIMMAEISHWESIFLFSYPASTNCIPFGSVKKGFGIKLCLYSIPYTLLLLQFQLANLKISLILQNLVKKKELKCQDRQDTIFQNHFAKKPPCP